MSRAAAVPNSPAFRGGQARHGLSGCARARSPASLAGTILETAIAFTLRSNSFKDGDYLGMDHILSADFGLGCAGGNQSPHLAWSGAPSGTKSFAITCFDPARLPDARSRTCLSLNRPRETVSC